MNPSEPNQQGPQPTGQPPAAPTPTPDAATPPLNTPQTLAPPVAIGGVMPQRPDTAGPVQAATPAKPTSNPNSTQNTLQIAECY